LTDQPAKPSDLIYEDTGAAAPLVYFDIVGAYGTMNGSIEVELATRILVPKPDGSTEVKFISSGRIRCTANAAANLRNGLDAALKMLEQPQANMAAIAAGKLNSRKCWRCWRPTRLPSCPITSPGPATARSPGLATDSIIAQGRSTRSSEGESTPRGPVGKAGVSAINARVRG
jgi:hypothetical protein